MPKWGGSTRPGHTLTQPRFGGAFLLVAGQPFYENLIEDCNNSGAMESTVARILVIDDNESFRESVRDLLEALGHAVITARDGAEGVC